ncbi:MAG: hypothetical protein D6768_00390 [Chloroflexi bacterium]|nr:MAG: hypothetical protein D6768_00390 [Chloroflexota bacterium]
MSSADSMLIFGLCSSIIILPILAVGTLFLIKRTQKVTSRAVIKMDGANCVHTLEGNVEIRPTRITSIIALVLLVPAGIVAIIVTLFSLFNLNIQGMVLSGGGSMMIVFAVTSLIRALRRPAVYFKTYTRMLEIGHGPSQRVIPFDDIARVLWDRGGVSLRLQTNEEIPLGALSASSSGIERTKTIAQLIADVTGAKMN